MNTVTSICDICGKEFTAVKRTQKYCSKECRRISVNRRAHVYYTKFRESHPLPTVYHRCCNHRCQKVFTPPPEKPNQYYCCPECKRFAVRNPHLQDKPHPGGTLPPMIYYPEDVVAIQTYLQITENKKMSYGETAEWLRNTKKEFDLNVVYDTVRNRKQELTYRRQSYWFQQPQPADS